MLETIITEVLEKEKKLFVTFKDLGSVYIDWQHIFPSKILNKQEANNLERKVAHLPSKRLNRPFNIIQVKAPISVKNSLPEEFINGHYKEQMWNYFAVPGSIAYINEDLHSILFNKKKFEEELTEIKEEIRELLPNSGKGYQSKVFNKLNQFYFNKEIEEIATNSDTKKLTDNILNLREKAQETFSKIEKIANSHKINVNYNKEKKSVDLTLPSPNNINVRGPLNYQEIMQQKWLFLDIEIPHFDRENPEISWVGLAYYQNGKLTKEIHTLSDLNEQEVAGYKTYTHDSQLNLVDAVKNSVIRENPYYISAFNANFDLIKLREANFKIGERESNPVKEVSTKFFERIGIYGKEVVDLLRWAQTCFDYLPNQKLETVAREVLGEENFTKSISYQEMADLEEIARSCNEKKQEAAKKIASYLAGDVDVMVDLFESKTLQSFLEDMSYLSNSFHTPMIQLIYSPKQIQAVQKRIYFHEKGIYYDEVYRKTRFNQNKKREKRNKFNLRLKQLFDSQKHTGLFENVHQCYLPYGFYLRKIISRKLPESNSLFSIKSNDNVRRFYLSRFANSLAEKIIVDYEDYKQKELFQDKDEINKAENRIKGKYKTTINEIEQELDLMKRKIETWVNQNNLKIIHQDRAYLYVQGGNDKSYVRAPIVELSHLEKVLIGEDKQNNNLFFHQAGTISGLKISSQPGYFNNLFEMETYGYFLDNLLQGKNQEALEELYFACDSLISEKVEPERLIWKNKSANYNFAFTNHGRINFTPHYEGDIKVDNIGNYVESQGKRIYLIDVNQVKIDWEKYLTRNENKIKNFLYPLIGKDYLKFTRPMDEVVILNESEFKCMAKKIEFNLREDSLI